MMKYIKRSERILKAAAFNAGLKSVGGVVKEVAEYSKWHELQNGINAGSRIQFKMFIMEADLSKIGGSVGYYLKDDMGMVASDVVANVNDVKDWLVGHSYKTVHDWYIQDCGMSEETWREWNASND